MEARGKDAWEAGRGAPAGVSAALRAYAAMATSAAKGTVRVNQIER